MVNSMKGGGGKHVRPQLKGHLFSIRSCCSPSKHMGIYEKELQSDAYANRVFTHDKVMWMQTVQDVADSDQQVVCSRRDPFGTCS